MAEPRRVRRLLLASGALLVYWIVAFALAVTQLARGVRRRRRGPS